MVALTRWGETTLGVFDPSSAKMIPLAKRETGALVVSLGGSRLATLVREGPNPAKNHIEILDWRNGSSLIVEPATDDAVLGFAFDGDGKQLSYATMNLRNSRSTHVTWRVGLLDLERQQARIVVDSAAAKIGEGGVPVPFGWSGRTGRLYLQGWSPFRGMIRQGIWAMSPERGEPAKIVPAPNYTGVPRLSPDGARLAYLGTDMGSLPTDFVAAPGAPPGNLLSVMDLTAGAEVPWARGGRTAFGALAWSADGEEIVAAEQAWLNGRFRDVEIRRIGKGTAVSVAKIDSSRSAKEVASILECRERNLFWVERERAAAKLYVDRGGTSQLLFELPDGAIQLLGCLNR
jgi:Tol biopolymer transport system component